MWCMCINIITTITTTTKAPTSAAAIAMELVANTRGEAETTKR